jgi:hypothetical protein
MIKAVDRVAISPSPWKKMPFWHWSADQTRIDVNVNQSTRSSPFPPPKKNRANTQNRFYLMLSLPSEIS